MLLWFIWCVSNVTWQKQQKIDHLWRNSTTKIVYHLNIHLQKKIFRHCNLSRMVAYHSQLNFHQHRINFNSHMTYHSRQNIYFLTWKCCLNERWRSLLLTYFNPTHLLVRQPSPKLDVQKFERLSYLFYSIPIFHILEQKLFQNVTVCCIKEMS